MIRELRITVLADDAEGVDGCVAEHGFSLWIEADGQKILFDAGRSRAFIVNGRSLGVDVKKADTLVVSHGHYDHTGGIADLLMINPSIRVFHHPGIFVPRFSRRNDGTMKPIGIRRENVEALGRFAGSINRVSETTLISDSIGITGPVPRITPFEDAGGDFYFDKEAAEPDPVSDDMSMWIQTVRGLVVVTGCCHAGIINTLMHIKSINPNKTMNTVIGGLHLLQATEHRLKKTCDYLESIGIQQIVTCHCTGQQAEEKMENRFGNRLKRGFAGFTMRIS